MPLVPLPVLWISLGGDQHPKSSFLGREEDERGGSRTGGRELEEEEDWKRRIGGRLEKENWRVRAGGRLEGGNWRKTGGEELVEDWRIGLEED